MRILNDQSLIITKLLLKKFCFFLVLIITLEESSFSKNFHQGQLEDIKYQFENLATSLHPQNTLVQNLFKSIRQLNQSGKNWQQLKCLNNFNDNCLYELNLIFSQLLSLEKINQQIYLRPWDYINRLAKNYMNKKNQLENLNSTMTTIKPKIDSNKSKKSTNIYNLNTDIEQLINNLIDSQELIQEIYIEQQHLIDQILKLKFYFIQKNSFSNKEIKKLQLLSLKVFDSLKTLSELYQIYIYLTLPNAYKNSFYNNWFQIIRYLDFPFTYSQRLSLFNLKFTYFNLTWNEFILSHIKGKFLMPSEQMNSFINLQNSWNQMAREFQF